MSVCPACPDRLLVFTVSGALIGIAYAMLASEKRITPQSLIAVSPVVFLIFCLIWYKEALDTLIHKVCNANDADAVKVMLEVEIRFDKQGWAFADWLGVKNNGGDEDLEQYWSELHDAGFDRLDLVKDMSVDELQHSNIGLSAEDAKKLHREFKRLKNRTNLRKASMLKERYDIQLTKCKAVFGHFAGQLWQGKASAMLLRLMLQYAVAVQYYKSLKVHIMSFVHSQTLRCLPQRWKADKILSKFGSTAKRKLMAWFRVMKKRPGRLVDLDWIWEKAIKDLSPDDPELRRKRMFQLRTFTSNLPLLVL